MKKRRFDLGECSNRGDDGKRLHEDVSDDPVLASNHKIFLSHSGAQKEFVEHLCKALEDRCHYPFFDKRPDSLPKGKKFAGLICKAIKQCQLLVVVVSEEYFMSKWPMIELNAFVQAKEAKSTTSVGILPLFYGLSVSDLKDVERRQRWLEKWERFAMNDGKGLINVEDWKCAVDELTKFNGLSYDQELKQILAYENEIVSHICTLVSPDIKWNDAHVQGSAHEVILEEMKQIEVSQKYKVKVVGMYGVGGIGKTTTCKMLCNELANEYDGRVCYVEFTSTCSNSKEILQNVLLNLRKKSVEVVQELGEGECIDILYKNPLNQRTFLVIDNVWDNANSIKQARMFLKAPYHEDSLIVVTARSQSTLALLGIHADACLEMPDIDQVDATSLFLYYAADGEKFTTKKDLRSIEWCVKRCFFRKGDEGGFHYHPLALEALGRQLGCLGVEPSKWGQILSRVWNFNAFSGENAVFDVLRSGFDLLEPIEQAMFMDVGVFLPRLEERCLSLWGPWIGWKEHLCIVYKKNEQEIQSWLDSLKRKGLLQDADLASGRMSMHDLYSEFVKLEALGKFDEAPGMWSRMWLFMDRDEGDFSELEVTPAGGCWQKLSRLSVRQTEAHQFEKLRAGYRSPAYSITSLDGVEWRYFSNVLVLQLYGLNSVKGRLDLKGMTCLRSLQFHDLKCLERLEGLESLKNLTYFEWNVSHKVGEFSTETYILGQFPASLRYLYISRRCLFSGCDSFARCVNLSKLSLLSVEVGVRLDLSNCASLETVWICGIKSLQILSGLNTTGASKLRSLEIGRLNYGCPNLVDVPGLEQLDGLDRLDLSGCGLREVPWLLSLTKLESLSISTHKKPAELWIPHQIQELYYEKWSLSSAPRLSAFKQLQVLDFRWSWVTGMCGMGDLPALRSLNLDHCWIERLPDLSKSMNLEDLNLDCCYYLQVHEEDIQMLAMLPSLHPVRFSRAYECYSIRLDLRGRKVLKYLGPSFYAPESWLAWKEGELEERELVLPPVSMKYRGSWDIYQHDEWDMENFESDVEEVEDEESDSEDV